MAAGFQGDPAAALLEVLDPAQNHSSATTTSRRRSDLSSVLFIATSNQLGTVHPALLDRMEIVQLAGYTEEEKVHIARRYLLPRQASEHGLTPEIMVVTDGALRTIIRRVHAQGRRPGPRAAARGRLPGSWRPRPPPARRPPPPPKPVTAVDSTAGPSHLNAMR